MKSKNLMILGAVLIGQISLLSSLILVSIFNQIIFLFVAILGFPVGIIFINYFFDRNYLKERENKK